MSKPKNPLLSLGAQGSIGDAITFQKRGQGTIARKKPTPKNPQSLAQMYHRWQYEDYAYRWRQQSQATQQYYRSEGAKRHLTGFSHWMSVMLTDLPDLVAWWKLDDNRGATTPDSSRNQNTATIVGASPIAGVLDGALDFDGINDHLDIPDSPSTKPTAAMSFECFFNPSSIAPFDCLAIKTTAAAWTDGWGIYFNANLISFFVNDWALHVVSLPFIPAASYGIMFHACVTFDGTELIIYLDGVPSAPVAYVAAINPSSIPLYIGRAWGLPQWTGCIVDNPMFYNRCLDPTEVLRHAGRRYPL